MNSHEGEIQEDEYSITYVSLALLIPPLARRVSDEGGFAVVPTTFNSTHSRLANLQLGLIDDTRRDLRIAHTWCRVSWRYVYCEYRSGRTANKNEYRVGAPWPPFVIKYDQRRILFESSEQTCPPTELNDGVHWMHACAGHK